ncbi:hypothetical protein KGD82_27815 (plasmid) [Nocardiopsis eucommiae]|uniref:DUF8175 domain-containing protein n=1 Tax=Nocardiopsis eucommiae TaxID=2831970 RepID=A0A975LD64_9ACTN|nr:hypothetical protein KGD82_27815 [Nocardiopsis eucommiae]
MALVVVAFSLGRVSLSSDEAPASDQTQEEVADAEADAPGDEIREEVSIDGQLFSADDLTLQDHAGVPLLPFSAEHGPHEDQGGWVREFSRTPQGALLAGAHIYMQSANSADLPPEAIQESLNNQIIGEHSTTFISESMERDFEPDPNREYVRIEAYKYHEYNDNEAVFEMTVANLEPGTEEVAIRVSVLVSMGWRDGDWRFYVPEDMMGEARIIDSLEGFEFLPGFGE